MKIQTIHNNKSLNFKAHFVENQQYRDLYQYAKQQKNFSDFQTVINKLKTLPDIALTLNYGKKKVQENCDYGGELKQGRIPFTTKTFVNIINENANLIIPATTFVDENIPPIEAAYKKILSLCTATTILYQELFSKPNNNVYQSRTNRPKAEKDLVKIVDMWDEQDKNLYTKFKSDFHTYPLVKNNKIADKMSILDFLTNVKGSRFFDFNSEYMLDKINYYDFFLLGKKINAKRPEVTKEEIEQFLYDIIQDKTLSKKMVEEFSGNPRNSEEVKNKIIKLLGNDEQAYDTFYKWYHDETFGYKRAYSDYYNDIYNNAKDLITLIKISPNIAPWVFNNKAKNLGIEPTLGDVPKHFGNLSDYRTLINELLKFDKEYKLKSSQMQNNKNTEIEYDIIINNKSYKIKPLSIGHSSKLKYKVTPDSGDTYIIKFNKDEVFGETQRTRRIRENQAMRGDSPYLDAMVDFYLKENGCPNAADIQFFDYKSKSAVYKMTTGTTFNPHDNILQNIYLFNNSKYIQDIKRLGVIVNDIHKGNFIVDNQGNNILIDTGHVDFSLLFRPMVMGKHISLSNLCGRSLS